MLEIELISVLCSFHPVQGDGRPDLTNLPRKINICISPSRDDFPHTQINDVAFEAVQHPDSGEVVFNLMVSSTLCCTAFCCQ